MHRCVMASQYSCLKLKPSAQNSLSCCVAFLGMLMLSLLQHAKL